MKATHAHPLVPIAAVTASIVAIAALFLVAPIAAVFATIFAVIFGAAALTARAYPRPVASVGVANASAGQIDPTPTSSMGILD